MSKDLRISLLISLKLNEEATPEELRELEMLLKNNPELQERQDNVAKIYKQLGRHATGMAEEAFEQHLERLNNEEFVPYAMPEASFEDQNIAPTRTLWQNWRYKILWVAAAASVLLFLFLFRKNENSQPPLAKNTVSTKSGDKASITLPDGSKVWLNGNSKITYEDFRKETREVFLSGEAYFDVAKDKTKPFIIHTRTISLKVLGTAFNVRSYDNEIETETALVHGSVEVTLRNRPDQKIFLKPGEKLLVKNIPVDTSLKSKKVKRNEDSPIAVLTNMHYYGADSSSVETSWTKNQLVFNDESLDKIALNLERWFNVRVTIVNESLRKEKFTATIEEDDKLEEVLEALKLIEGFHYSVKDKEVIISR